MKEYSINLNINTGSVICILLTIFAGTGLLVYYSENGYIPSYKNGELKFIPKEDNLNIIS